jgi:hypothetical protein
MTSGPALRDGASRAVVPAAYRDHGYAIELPKTGIAERLRFVPKLA